MLQLHAGMRAAYRRLAKLHVAIRRSLGSTKRYASAIRTARPDEADFLTRVAAGGNLEPTWQELERSVCCAPIPN